MTPITVSVCCRIIIFSSTIAYMSGKNDADDNDSEQRNQRSHFTKHLTFECRLHEECHKNHNDNVCMFVVCMCA